ncbi:MAG: hypothetical protein C4537_02605 [Acholeplasma sp.]|jgi:hypothetical protein|nr:MAG: hypothetical protein C4537_02605 [Acholeplasma sp.]
MRRIQHIGAIVFALFMVFLLVGCIEEERTIVNVEIDPLSIAEDFDVSDFSISDLKLIVTFSDETEETVTVTEAMISSADLAMLLYRGTYEITINYQDLTVELTLVLHDQVTETILFGYYEYATITLGFVGTYEAWIDSITSQGTLQILKAEYNAQNEVVLTLSNMQTVNLGQMITETYEVTFYDKDGNVIALIVVPRGGSAIPPAGPEVPDYTFIGWDGVYQNVMSDVIVYPIYQRNYTEITVDDADELIISIDRLEHAQFEVDLDSIFSQTSETMGQQESRTLSSILNTATQMDTDPFGPDYYIPHNYWQHMFYHESLYEQPAIIDGYHVITQTLTTYSDHALNNLYETTEQVTSHARERADWAVEYITVVDTWVNDGDFKYLLHYDEVLDRVELYTIWNYEPLSITSYEKIYVFYNINGEEVIESWVYQIYSDPAEPGYPGVMGYHNSVGGRDFNYYAVWLDESYEPNQMHHFRGINMNEEGYYEYYDNDLHMISGDYGWYTIQPYIYPNLEEIVYVDQPNITLYSPDASSNVITIFKNFDSGYQVSLYLPAMNGVEALLVEEGGMYQENQDSPATQAMLTENGFTTMPDWWVVENHNIEIMKGLRTSQGTFYEEHGILSGTVTLQFINIDIGSEGLRDYDYYYNRFGVAILYIDVDTIEDVVTELTAYLEEIGLSYKYGDTALLFEEMGYVYANYEALGQDVRVTNYTLWGPEAMYTDYETYLSAVDEIVSNLEIRDDLMAMEETFSLISMSEMPAKTDLDSITFIRTENAIVGALELMGTFLSTDQLTATLSRSPLLQINKSYSLYYGLMIGGRLIELAHTTPQVFTGQDLSFSSDFRIDIPLDLVIGDYQLVVFFAKNTEDGFIRISNIMPAPVGDFMGFEFYLLYDEFTEEAITFKPIYVDGSVIFSFFKIDAFSPKVYIKNNEPFETTYEEYEFHGLQGRIDATLIAPFYAQVRDLIKALYVMDNFDGEMELNEENFSEYDAKVSVLHALLEEGWRITVIDEAGNVTDITLTIQFGYVATFMADEVLVDKAIQVPGGTVVPPVAPEKKGHTFIGWGTGDFIMNEDRTFTAVYEVNTYTITWTYLDDVVGTTEVVYGDNLGLFEMPTLEGHFYQWQIFYESMPDMDITIQGNYYKHTYTVIFYLDGNVYQEVNYQYGDPIIYPIITAPEGFHFSGWDPIHETMPSISFYTYGLILPNE